MGTSSHVAGGSARLYRRAVHGRRTKLRGAAPSWSHGHTRRKTPRRYIMSRRRYCRVGQSGLALHRWQSCSARSGVPAAASCFPLTLPFAQGLSHFTLDCAATTFACADLTVLQPLRGYCLESSKHVPRCCVCVSAAAYGDQAHEVTRIAEEQKLGKRLVRLDPARNMTWLDADTNPSKRASLYPKINPVYTFSSMLTISRK